MDLRIHSFEECRERPRGLSLADLFLFIIYYLYGPVFLVLLLAISFFPAMCKTPYAPFIRFKQVSLYYTVLYAVFFCPLGIN
jgi:hypothetical protein